MGLQQLDGHSGLEILAEGFINIASDVFIDHVFSYGPTQVWPSVSIPPDRSKLSVLGTSSFTRNIVWTTMVTIVTHSIRCQMTGLKRK